MLARMTTAHQPRLQPHHVRWLVFVVLRQTHHLKIRGTCVHWWSANGRETILSLRNRNNAQGLWLRGRCLSSRAALMMCTFSSSLLNVINQEPVPTFNRTKNVMFSYFNRRQTFHPPITHAESRHENKQINSSIFWLLSALKKSGRFG